MRYDPDHHQHIWRCYCIGGAHFLQLDYWTDQDRDCFFHLENFDLEYSLWERVTTAFALLRNGHVDLGTALIHPEVAREIADRLLDYATKTARGETLTGVACGESCWRQKNGYRVDDFYVEEIRPNQYFALFIGTDELDLKDPPAGITFDHQELGFHWYLKEWNFWRRIPIALRLIRGRHWSHFADYELNPQKAWTLSENLRNAANIQQRFEEEKYGWTR